MNYRHINNLSGWLVFAISAFVYILTSEPTLSWWDCGEYIATAYGLQVGHPPGAPLFQIIGRFFSFFAFGNELLVARMVNTMSALSSAFTILFLFWSITHLARKVVDSSIVGATIKNSVKNSVSGSYTAAIIGSGLVGALAYTFTDSFWFSAVEGEVYAMSSFFTAFVFWAILKWEEQSDDKHAIRWILLIAFMIGLSIGVHLLNLLTIPAIALVIYFKKYKPTFKGTLIALLLSVLILGGVMNVIIPWIVKLAGWFELFFVNTLGLPFNTGTIIYFLGLTGGIVWGIMYTRKRGKVLWNTIVLSFTFILIGYSSFFMLVIRANANTPINENEPTNAISLLSYLNREQYGDWPLLYGPYYNAPVKDYEDGSPVYHKNDETGKYEIINNREDTEPVYDEEFMTIFPRMWSSQEDSHRYFYQRFGKIKGTPVQVPSRDGKSETIMKPTFAENLRFFFSYQIQHMYIRYFMWNFAGRQNDNQGLGEDLNGNWISGFNFIDELRLGPQKDIPYNLHSKARNTYYLLPLILGLFGLIFHINRHPKDSLVVMLLFIMTGLAIVAYLNQFAPQPRERDYAYAASFYAFSIWIGMGVLGLAMFLQKYIFGSVTGTKTSKAKVSADGVLNNDTTVADNAGVIQSNGTGNKNSMLYAGLIATLTCLVVPAILAIENWNDHDRSGRYTARAIAKNYLESCDKNAILFTMGDNDTFPLWYMQEVEKVRTDVRVVNLSLLNSDWYIGQMKRKVYDSEPVPISLSYDQFKSGTFDVMYIAPDERIKGSVSLAELFEIMRKKPDALRIESSIGPVDVIPSSNFYIDVDSALVVQNGTVQPDETDSILSSLHWTIKERALRKSQIILLDIIASNNWKRPIYFSSTAGADSYIGLNPYLRNEGFALRLVPVRKEKDKNFEGYVHSGILYDKLMNVYEYGNMNNPSVYLDETNTRMINNLRTLFVRLAGKLAEEGKMKEAIAVSDKCLQTVPNESLPFNYYLLPLADIYMKAGAPDKAGNLLNQLLFQYSEELDYYFSFPANKMKALEQDIRQGLMVINGIASIANENGNEAIKQNATLILDKQFKRYEKAGF